MSQCIGGTGVSQRAHRVTSWALWLESMDFKLKSRKIRISLIQLSIGLLFFEKCSLIIAKMCTGEKTMQSWDYIFRKMLIDLFTFLVFLHALFLCPSLKKGAILFCTCRSVCRYVACRSSESAQYFLTPLLESCLSWYNRCPLGVNDPYWGTVVKGQVQIVGLWKNVVHSIALDPFAWKLPNLQSD